MALFWCIYSCYIMLGLQITMYWKGNNDMAYIALAVAAVLIGIDQLTKYLVHTNMELHQTIPLISIGDKEILNFSYERNTGAAFSILQGKQVFLIVITLIVILAAIYLLISKRVRKPAYVWSIAIIIAGGVGNLIDRIANGYVIDFIDFRIINFAIFNVADICAVCGGIALFLFVVIDEIKLAKESKKDKALVEEPAEAEENSVKVKNEQ